MTVRKPRPTEVLEGHIGYLLAKLGALSSSRMDAELAPYGINRMQFGLLKILAAVGPGSQQALSGDLGMPPSRMVALVDDLEDQGFVARERSSSDRRVNEIRLTREGRAVLDRVNKVAVRWQDELLADLSSSEQKQLVELLRRVTARHLGSGTVQDHP
ncbi:MAG: MarR family transcriptional regulator [Acidimicrobiales bacterium]|nr:MarR family transcriptional regulator [Acidimicrobiales bacterium]